MQPLGENTANTPAFLGKLWKMVNDPSTDHLICWSPSGTSFVIPNQVQFWYELLPLYYKHNNMSSFVRQLNMYGFHKISTVENGTMDSYKDEIQFSHPFFVKDKPELLRNIKRKVCMSKRKQLPCKTIDSQPTTSKAPNENSNNKHDELSKVLNDVKQLRGRQANVDSQLNAMKQENALLWREVAILRQKHLKQQKIVNKLIQFLVTLVQPSRMTVGVKRGYQLMLHESPNKKSKVSNNKSNSNVEGPTIHELDSELDLAPNLYDDDGPTIESPAPSVPSQQTDLNSPLQSQLLVEDNGAESWDKPDYVVANDLALDDPDLTEENLINTLDNEATPTTTTNNVNLSVDQKVFLNPTTQDTLLSNLIKNNFTVKSVDKESKTNKIDPKLFDTVPPLSPTPVSSSNNMAVATRDTNLCDVIKSLPITSDSVSSDLNNHIEATQSELDQFKDILNGYNSFVDANALLGLFNGDSPTYDLNVDEKNDNLVDPADPLVSGSELAPYGNNFDFTELLDDSIDGDNTTNATIDGATSSTINTPQIITEEPVFPAIRNIKKE